MVNIELLDELKAEFVEIKYFLNSEGNDAAKKKIKQAIEEIKNDNLDRAKELFKEGKELALKENKISSEFNKLKTKIHSDGPSKKMAEELTDIMKEGDLEKADKLIQNLTESIEIEKNILDKIQEAEELIGKKIIGANLREAKKLKKEALSELKSGNFKHSEELAEKSKMAAKPTTGSLLQKARDIAEDAESNFSSKDFEKSIDLWKKSLEEYKRAKTVASERKEDEVLERLEKVEATIHTNINNAKIAIDNRDMLKNVELASSKVKEGNESFHDGKFIEAKEAYEEGKTFFEQALDFAKKRNFAQDKAKIKDEMENIELGIEASLLHHGDSLLLIAESKFGEKQFNDAEKEFISALEYLTSLKLNRKDDLSLFIERGRKGMIDSKIEQGKMKMREAEENFTGKKFDKAREDFRNARTYLESVMDEASGLGLTLAELNGLIQTCTSNISAAVENLTMVGGIEHKFVGVDDFERSTARFEYRRQQPVPDFSFPMELKEEYEAPEYWDEGGNSWVYKARRKGDSAIVAVKIPKVSDRKSGRNFVDEVSLWKDLRHNNIVKIFDYNAIPRPYIAMEFLENSMDKQKLPLDPRDAAYQVFKVMEGLKYAHGRGKLHLDLKPANILLASDGEPKITDWGLGKVLRSSTFTKGKSKGFTSLYAAPEQINDDMVDARTDIFQIGHIFYELVTGKPPFESEKEAAIIEKVKNITPELPSSINSKAKLLDEIIMKCLEKDMANRFQSVEEMQKAIAKLLGLELEKTVKVTKSRMQRIIAFTELIEITAKSGDMNNCIKWLGELKFSVNSSELQTMIEKEIDRLKYMAERKMEIDDSVPSIERILHKAKMEA